MAGHNCFRGYSTYRRITLVLQPEASRGILEIQRDGSEFLDAFHNPHAWPRLEVAEEDRVIRPDKHVLYLFRVLPALLQVGAGRSEPGAKVAVGVQAFGPTVVRSFATAVREAWGRLRVANASHLSDADARMMERGAEQAASGSQKERAAFLD
eukprot:jgi/Tetstr1/432827/TSEL_022178.t1